MFSKINLQVLSPKERSLFKEISNEDVSKVTTLVLEENVDVNIRDTLNRSPLMRAVVIDDESTRKEMTSLFIQNGADVNMIDRHGKSALMMACREEGREDAVRLLMDSTKTDPNLQDEDGNSALIQAIEFENLPAVQLLLSDDYLQRIDVNAENYSSQTAITVAAKLRNDEICLLIASTGKVDLSRVPKHLLKQMSQEVKREARHSKSRLSRTKSSGGTPTSKDAPVSFANQISPSNTSKTFNIPTPIPDTENERDTQEDRKSPSEERQDSSSSKDRMIENKENLTDGNPQEKEVKSKEVPAKADEIDRVDDKQDLPSPKKQEPSNVKSQNHTETDEERQPKSINVSDKPKSPTNDQSPQAENTGPREDPEKPEGLAEPPTKRSQSRQETQRVSSGMSTASFISEPPRPLASKEGAQRGWTTVPAVLPAANKWRQRTRAHRARNRPLRAKDQQPYVTKSGRVIHPNSVHDKKYEDIQESRAMSRMSGMDTASAVSVRPPKESRMGRASRQSKISIA